MIAPPANRAPLPKMTQQLLLERAINIAMNIPDERVQQAQMYADRINAEVLHRYLSGKQNRYDPERYAIRLQHYATYVWRGLALRADLERRGIIVESEAA